MRIYLAGPMSGLPFHNAPEFDRAAELLRAAGLEVVSPMDINRANPRPDMAADGTIGRAAYCELVRLDLAALLECDAVAVLPGWSQSRGAQLEVAVARAIGLDVYVVSHILEEGMGARPLSCDMVVAPVPRPVDGQPGDPFKVNGVAPSSAEQFAANQRYAAAERQRDDSQADGAHEALAGGDASRVVLGQAVV
jgi:hypothetical protein